METKNMNMRPTPKKDNGNGLIGGALGAAIGTAFGATFGVGGAYAYNRLANGQEPEVELNDVVTDDDVTVADPNDNTVHVHTHVVVVDPEPTPEPDPEPAPEPEPFPYPEPDPEPDPDTEVEVISFQRITLEDGGQADMAVVSINGQEAALVDMNLDGWADAMMADIDASGDISDNEIVPISSDESIAMAPLAQAVNYDYDTDPLNNGGSGEVVIDDDDCCTPETDDDNLILANNEGNGVIPDYVNNGDVSDMALV